MRHFAPSLSRAIPTYEALMLLNASWPKIVGPEIAKCSHPTRLIDTTLQITTVSPAWSEQLSFLSGHVLQAISRELPRISVTRLRFRVGRISDL